jgi:bifunctional NMN adenylyltransferase/nudix hydrolase
MVHGTSVIVGRFQVAELSDAHKALIDYAYSERTNLVIFVGVSRLRVSFRDPLDFHTIEANLRQYARGAIILPLPDTRSDEEWVATLNQRIREIAVGEVRLFGGRDSFLDCYLKHSKQYKVVVVPEVEGVSGTQLREESGWYPLPSQDFREGVIYASQRKRPTGMPTVDVAIVDAHAKKMLLARKPGEDKWRFVGGFFDPEQDRGLEYAAMREAREETGLQLKQFPKYITSHKVDDWRYRGERDQIITSLFLGINEHGAAKAQDDIAEVRWFPLSEIEGLFQDDQIQGEHDILMKRLLDSPVYQELL